MPTQLATSESGSLAAVPEEFMICIPSPADSPADSMHSRCFIEMEPNRPMTAPRGNGLDDSNVAPTASAAQALSEDVDLFAGAAEAAVNNAGLGTSEHVAAEDQQNLEVDGLLAHCHALIKQRIQESEELETMLEGGLATPPGGMSGPLLAGPHAQRLRGRTGAGRTPSAAPSNATRANGVTTASGMDVPFGATPYAQLPRDRSVTAPTQRLSESRIRGSRTTPRRRMSPQSSVGGGGGNAVGAGNPVSPKAGHRASGPLLSHGGSSSARQRRFSGNSSNAASAPPPHDGPMGGGGCSPSRSSSRLRNVTPSDAPSLQHRVPPPNAGAAAKARQAAASPDAVVKAALSPTSSATDLLAQRQRRASPRKPSARPVANSKAITVNGNGVAANGGYRKGAITMRNSMAPVPPEEWTPEEVGDYLDALNYSTLRPVFIKHQVNGRMLFALTEEDLEGTIGIKNFMVRGRLLNAFGRLRRSVPALTNQQPSMVQAPQQQGNNASGSSSARILRSASLEADRQSSAPAGSCNCANSLGGFASSCAVRQTGVSASAPSSPKMDLPRQIDHTGPCLAQAIGDSKFAILSRAVATSSTAPGPGVATPPAPHLICAPPTPPSPSMLAPSSTGAGAWQDPLMTAWPRLHRFASVGSLASEQPWSAAQHCSATCGPPPPVNLYRTTSWSPQRATWSPQQGPPQHPAQIHTQAIAPQPPVSPTHTQPPPCHPRLATVQAAVGPALPRSTTVTSGQQQPRLKHHVGERRPMPAASLTGGPGGGPPIGNPAGSAGGNVIAWASLAPPVSPRAPMRQ